MIDDITSDVNWRDRVVALFQATAAQLSPRHASIRDYRRLAAIQTFMYGRARAMQVGVGDQWRELGRLELLLLKHLGLRDGSFIMDVGCGSGRLAASLAASSIAVDYHGSDVVPAFIRNAKRISPKHFRYTRVERIEIPECDNCADFVTFFSVATHLQLHETYVYLQEARRIAKPGGIIVVSFLDLGNPVHFQIFQKTAQNASKGKLLLLNMFFDASALKNMAEHVGLVVQDIFTAGIPFIPTDEGLEPFGQSVAVLRKELY